MDGKLDLFELMRYILVTKIMILPVSYEKLLFIITSFLFAPQAIHNPLAK
jgi:hypothetical protein